MATLRSLFESASGMDFIAKQAAESQRTALGNIASLGALTRQHRIGTQLEGIFKPMPRVEALAKQVAQSALTAQATQAAESQRTALGNLGMVRAITREQGKSTGIAGNALRRIQPHLPTIDSQLEGIIKSASGLDTLAKQATQTALAAHKAQTQRATLTIRTAAGFNSLSQQVAQLRVTPLTNPHFTESLARQNRLHAAAVATALANIQPHLPTIDSQLEGIIKSASGLDTLVKQATQSHFSEFASELWGQISTQEIHNLTDATIRERDYLFLIALILHVATMGFVLDLFFSDFADPNRFEMLAAVLTAIGAGQMTYSATRKFPHWIDHQLKTRG